MEKLADVLIKNEMAKDQDKDVIIYGLSTGIELAFNIITTVTLGVMFGLVLESLIFFWAFSFIHTYAGGYHCEKAIYCYLISSGIVVLVLLLVKNTPVAHMLANGGCIVPLEGSASIKLVDNRKTFQDV